MNTRPEHHKLIEQLERCELKAGEFDHRHHVQAAFHLIKTCGLLEATLTFVELIKNFARHHGAAGLYNETITLFFLQVIDARIDADPSLNWEQFCNNNQDLFNAKALLERHYSKSLLAHQGTQNPFLFARQKALSRAIGAITRC